MVKAFIFPGQGSQIVGMGKDFYDNFEIARETFNIVDEKLQRKLSNTIFNGPLEELTLTTNAQPALMAVSSAIINVIKQQTNKDISKLCNYVAGHSLGEYSALYAVDSLNLEVVTELLQVRSISMQEACPQNIGAMAACINISINELEQILQEASKVGLCQIANDNIEGQIVISGKLEAINQAINLIKASGYKAIKLKVSAPFHCDLMKPAEEKMKNALDKVIISPPLVPIVQNYVAAPVSDINQIKQNLVFQVCGRVKWRETLELFAKLGVTEIIEIGSGNILTGMIKKTTYNFTTLNISNVAEFDFFLKAL